MIRRPNLNDGSLSIDMNFDDNEFWKFPEILPQPVQDYRNFSVGQLRSALIKHNLPTTGRKQDLVRNKEV